MSYAIVGNQYMFSVLYTKCITESTVLEGEFWVGGKEIQAPPPFYPPPSACKLA